MTDSDPQPQYESFAEFWPFYVGAHQHPICRLLHYIGGLGAMAIVALVAFSALSLDGSWWPLLLAPVFGYGCAWTGHFWAERNHPATFEYPWFSIRAEFLMLWLGLTGRMGGEVHRYYGASTSPEEADADRVSAVTGDDSPGR